MDKNTKEGLFISLSIAFVIIAIIAWPVYFVCQFSATYSHLKDYEYSMTTKQLETTIIKILKSDSCFKYTITDSTGTKENRNYYMTIEHKYNNDSLSYHITYSNDSKSNCKLGLVSVYNKTKKYGGSKDGDKNVEKLIGIFDQHFIERLNTNRY